jgi:hypothetical protein
MPVRIDCKTSHVAEAVDRVTPSSQPNEPCTVSSEALVVTSREKISHDSGSVASLAPSSRLPSAALQSRPGLEDGASTFAAIPSPLEFLDFVKPSGSRTVIEFCLDEGCPICGVGPVGNAWGSSRSGAV